MSSSSFVLHTQARRHDWSGEGQLSIKTFFGGQARYDSGGGLFAVDDQCYLLLNHGQPYTITVDALTPVESFCLFFAPGLAQEVHRSLLTNTESLLDNPAPPATAPLTFFDRTYPHDTTLSPALFALRLALAEGPRETAWLDEQLRRVMTALLHAQQNTLAEVARLPAARPATRVELYRRLHRARDYARASLDQPLTLDDLARAACLSPTHLLRAFKQVFHQTPYQYLTELRLARACHLLTHTALSVTEIGLAVGFESLGSFSWLFHQRLGRSPQAYRAQRQNGDFGEADRGKARYNRSVSSAVETGRETDRKAGTG